MVAVDPFVASEVDDASVVDAVSVVVGCTMTGNGNSMGAVVVAAVDEVSVAAVDDPTSGGVSGVVAGMVGATGVGAGGTADAASCIDAEFWVVNAPAGAR